MMGARPFNLQWTLPSLVGGSVLITPDQISEQLGIDGARQRRRPDHIAEQHRDLAPLRLARRLRVGWLRFGRLRVALRERFQ